jgi:hypothetical protein
MSEIERGIEKTKTQSDQYLHQHQAKRSVNDAMSVEMQIWPQHRKLGTHGPDTPHVKPRTEPHQLP